MNRKVFQRREYEIAAMAAVRERRQIVLFWARRCHKSTTLGAIAFDEMAGSRGGRTVIAASASLLLGRELVGMALGATEQAAIVTREAAAVRNVFESGADDRGLEFSVADASQNKILQGLTEEDFADLYKSSNMELRLYFDRTTYSRLKVIAPNPATARGWGGTVLRDEAGYTPAALETDLRIATKPIIDTDPTFKLIYASNLCVNDRHPFFEMTLPPPEMTFEPSAQGNFYKGENGILVHRVTLRDAYAAGHILFDEVGRPLTYEEFKARPENRLGASVNYDLIHESGGTAAIDLSALATAQLRGAETGCAFIYVGCDADFRQAADLLRANLGAGRVGIGFDVASTTGETSNPSSVTVTEEAGGVRMQKLVVVWKERKPQIVRERLCELLAVVRARPAGGPARRLCIDASNERLFAEETADALRDMVPVQLILMGASVNPLPAGYRDSINYKSYLGDLYSASVNDNRTAIPSSGYVKTDQRLVMKDQGRYVCMPDADGRHGDTFDSGKLAEFALMTGDPGRIVAFASRRGATFRDERTCLGI